MSTQHTPFEIFISYARRDNQTGWVTALRDHIIDDHRRFSTEPLRIFLDQHDIASMDDWRHRILGSLRHSKILLVCLSPNYFTSTYCHWEWEEYTHRQVHQQMGTDSIAAVYFVEIPGSDDLQNSRWYHAVRRDNYTDIRPWFPDGVRALQYAEVQQRMAALGDSLWERLQRARRAESAPGNLRRQNPYFVGRREELRQLHEQLTLGAVGVVTAVHGLGGQGKTELAIAYAHGWADGYPAGLWVLGAENHQNLLALLSQLAFDPAFGMRLSEDDKADAERLGRQVLVELQRRARALHAQDPDGGAAALLILDNVTEPGLLSLQQLDTLPRADGVRLLATTRLGGGALRGHSKNLALIAVDALAENDALQLIREHQPNQQFSSPEDETAAREIVRRLDGFTLAVEQVAVYLGLHPDISPQAFLQRLDGEGLISTDALPAEDDVAAQIRHQDKQLALILDATLVNLDAPTRTALRYAAMMPPDSVPWPWLRDLTVQQHSEIAERKPGYPDPWVRIQRRLQGLRLLTPGDQPELARIHRLVAAHVLAKFSEPEGRQDSYFENLQRYIAQVAWQTEEAVLHSQSTLWWWQPLKDMTVRLMRQPPSSLTAYSASVCGGIEMQLGQLQNAFPFLNYAIETRRGLHKHNPDSAQAA
ncbi:MAG: TIR domain-containing protein, partial [Candidatus Competibacteraceae bacterium]|nr:TIR domain-containing protein [Candidatus Competibacteraceae bacterium]